LEEEEEDSLNLGDFLVQKAMCSRSNTELIYLKYPINNINYLVQIHRLYTILQLLNWNTMIL
jgi:hypothetical protein